MRSLQVNLIICRNHYAMTISKLYYRPYERREVNRYFITYLVSVLTETYSSLVSTLSQSIYKKNCGEKALISPHNRFFERRNNLSPYISFQQLAIFAPWRSQKFLAHKDPITGNSFIDLGRLYVWCNISPNAFTRNWQMNSNVLDTSDQTINLSLAKPKQELQCGSRQVQ